MKSEKKSEIFQIISDHFRLDNEPLSIEELMKLEKPINNVGVEESIDNQYRLLIPSFYRLSILNRHNVKEPAEIQFYTYYINEKFGDQKIEYFCLSNEGLSFKPNQYAILFKEKINLDSKWRYKFPTKYQKNDKNTKGVIDKGDEVIIVNMQDHLRVYPKDSYNLMIKIIQENL